MMQDNELDRILTSRTMEAPSSNLASRIINQARPHQKSVSLLTKVQELFVFDMPALASVACLVIGIAIGVISNVDVTENTSLLSDWLSLISYEEEMML